jgi:hypothetical protein
MSQTKSTAASAPVQELRPETFLNDPVRNKGTAFSAEERFDQVVDPKKLVGHGVGGG